jgi:hypothetical protein
LTGTATFGLIFGGPRVFYDDTKGGGCTTTVHADEPRALHGVHETDGTNRLSTEQDTRKSTNELSKVTNRKISETLNGKIDLKMNIHFARTIMILPKCT